jgi:hypothetical protein
MLVGVFKKSGLYPSVLLLLVGVLLWVDAFFLIPDLIFIPIDPGPLFKIILPLKDSFPLASLVAAWTLMMIQAFMLNSLMISKGLVEKRNLLPALVFIVFSSSFPQMMSLNPVMFANFFLLICLFRIFETYPEKEVPFELFNVGMLVALAGLFYLPALWFFVLAFASLFIFRVGNIRGILATIIGFITPFFFPSGLLVPA